MGIQPWQLGQPGFYNSNQITFLNPFVDGICTYKPVGGVIDGIRSRDVNFGNPLFLRPGLLVAKSVSNNNYATWRVGTLTVATTNAGLTMTVSPTDATEINRRIGASGTVVVTGPSTANGSDTRQLTATYSAINTGTGVLTISALGTNQVEQINFGTAATGGNLELTVQTTAGGYVTTGTAAWNATDATYLAAINTALNTATGVAGGIVATAGGSGASLGIVLTYSGGAYAGKTWKPAQVALLPTGATAPEFTPVTAAVSGVFQPGAILSESGYATPCTFIKDELVMMGNGPVDWGHIPDSGRVNVAALVDYPTDTGIQRFVKTAMSTVAGPKFLFNDEVY